MKMESIQLAFLQLPDGQRIRLWHIDAYWPVRLAITDKTMVLVNGMYIEVDISITEFDALIQMVN